MLAGIAVAGLTLPACYPAQWVVDCKSIASRLQVDCKSVGKPVGSGAKALIYLGRYLYRGVIRENDIIACCGAVMTIVRTQIRSLLAGPVPMPPDIKGAG